MSHRTVRQPRSRLLSTALVTAACVGAAWASAASPAPVDEGMWTFDNPPVEHLRNVHGFEPTQAWLDHLRQSCTRFSTGGSGSIVSARGLVMTNHHVGADVIEKLSTAERDLLAEGFHAATPEEELPCPDLELDVLWEIRDVTERVNAAAEGAADTAAAEAARRRERSVIQDESFQDTGLKSEVVTLYQGGRFHLYRYKRYTDVRLVFAPEQQAAFFGGDTDNFEFPRYCLDVAFFRIYENGAPLAAEHWLTWSRGDLAEGDLIFVAGHPGRTERLNTVAHNEFLRDVRYPHVLGRLWRREVQLQTFSGRSAEHRRVATQDLHGVENSRKAYTGMYGGLLDPELFASKAAEERALRAAVEANPEWRAEWGGAWDAIAAACDTYADMYDEYVAVGGSRMALNSELFGIAAHLVRLADEREKPAGERLPEYTDAALPSLELGLFSPHALSTDLEIERLASGLSLMAERLGGADPLVLSVLDGASPTGRAAEAVRGTRLAAVAERRRLYEGGAAAVAASDDPMIALARRIDPHSRALRTRVENEVESVWRENYAKIAAARFALYGDRVYPDATFTLRLAFGLVAGYEQEGLAVEPFTRMAGVFERADERAGEEGFELPASWEAARETLDGDTPYDFVSTADIIGGNSGSPVVDRAGEVVGLIFDGNIQSLVSSIAYTDAQGRATSVDARAIVEALRSVYGAQGLVDELLERPAQQDGGL